MKKITLILFLFLSGLNQIQAQQTYLSGTWKLAKVIDVMTGMEIAITHKSKKDPIYKIEFDSTSCYYNTEINNCQIDYQLGEDNTIEFRYAMDGCTKVCCDDEFSKFLEYELCEQYYIKSNNTLILISEDYIYYLDRAEAPSSSVQDDEKE